MKKLLNYFKARRERKLRMWCMERAHSGLGYLDAHIAQSIYNWITREEMPKKNASETEHIVY